jgi:hypothetical protein
MNKQEVIDKISEIESENQTIEYDSDETLRMTMKFPCNVLCSISWHKDWSDEIIFYIYLNKELITADLIEIDTFIDCTKTLAKKLQDHPITLWGKIKKFFKNILKYDS